MKYIQRHDLQEIGHDSLVRLGYRSSWRCGVHTSRSLMLDDLRRLMDYIPDPHADRASYVHAIEEENCLGKRSVRSRKLTREYLITLYGLDPNVALFRVLRHFWHRDAAGRPLLAGLCAFVRDALLRQSAPFILAMQSGQLFSRQDLEAFLTEKNPDRFSMATLASVAGNLAASWTRMGLLSGVKKKYRTHAQATTGSVAYALFLGHVRGERGIGLFTTDFIRLLECSPDRAIELAEDASRLGWMVLNHIGHVVEVAFPGLLHAQEQEWLA
ncbi:MAG: hypothetical protein HQL65_20250 [Magnetococcales bacterium]|nr:hypothetical protein [Magnetococcales bacterium]